MNSSTSFKIKKMRRSSFPSSISSNTTTTIHVSLGIFVVLLLLIFHSYLQQPKINDRAPRRKPLTPTHHDPFIIATCSNTLYPSRCLTSLSSFNTTKKEDKNTRLRNLLEYSINKTISRVTKSRSKIIALHVDDIQGTMWVNTCVRLLDLTLTELQGSIKSLSNPTTCKHPLSYDTIKSMLNAAMTNKNTCIQSFFHKKLDYNAHSHLGIYVEKSFTPVMHMICNSLGIINFIENNGRLRYSCPKLDVRFW